MVQTMEIFDVSIIGAGPAGAITAYSLAKAGVKVQILEKANFPRQKTCGGGLTHRAFLELPFNIDAVIHQTVTQGVVGLNGRRYRSVHNDQPISHLIDRASFDAFLLQRAIDQGAVCHFGQRFLSFTQDNDLISAQTANRSYQSRYLVGADGVHSSGSRQLGLLQNRETSLAYEANMTTPEDSQDALTDSVTFDFGALDFGYAWIFPKRKHLNVGVFRSWPGKQASKKHLSRFIAKHPLLSRATIKQLRAYPIPRGIRREKLHDKRVLLVGDAANLADPWLGEGLYYAISSGKIAAEEILKHFKGDTPDLSGYTNKIHQRFTCQFSYARRLSLLINALPTLSVRLLQSNASLQGMIISLLRGEKTHAEMCHDLPAWLPRRILYKIRHFSLK